VWCDRVKREHDEKYLEKEGSQAAANGPRSITQAP
jgi:hypothetical protein